MSPLSLHPVSWFDIHGSFPDIFKSEKEEKCNVKSPTEVCYVVDGAGINDTTYRLLPTNQIEVLRVNPHDIAIGSLVSKFILLTAIKYKGDYKAAESYVMYKLMDMQLPYSRIGTNYFKIIEDADIWGAIHKKTEPWTKEAMTDDHTKTILKLVPKYDKFCIYPSNENYIAIHKNQYNLYCPFPHTPYANTVTLDDIPVSHGVMSHIFGSTGDRTDQIAQGYKYMKLLYQYPKQMLHILTLVSEERETGKTTVLNWIQMIFGGNYVLINPEELHSNFNSVYATKNIIAFEEAEVEKSQSIAKLKSLSTAKSIAVSQKFVQGYQVPFFGKIIMCTNKVRDFMRIDMEENRFWVRKLSPPKESNRNTSIEADLFKEIPKFLKYLSQLPAPDFTRSRFVLTQEEIKTPELYDLKEESKSGLRKEIEMALDDFFYNNDTDEFLADAKDIKTWFEKDNKITPSYIRKVLTQEMKLRPLSKSKRYIPFSTPGELKDKVGRPYLFKRTVEKIDNFNL